MLAIVVFPCTITHNLLVHNFEALWSKKDYSLYCRVMLSKVPPGSSWKNGTFLVFICSTLKGTAAKNRWKKKIIRQFLTGLFRTDRTRRKRNRMCGCVGDMLCQGPFQFCPGSKSRPFVRFHIALIQWWETTPKFSHKKGALNGNQDYFLNQSFPR